jgi:alkylmercury lyase
LHHAPCEGIHDLQKEIATMTTPKSPTLDQYWEQLAAGLPPFSPDEQRAAVTLYRELAKGQPVDAAQLAQALGVSPSQGRALLARDSIKAFIYPDEQGRVVGFGGLATAPMHHRFEVDGRVLWTWCAWDSLFIPDILGKRARVTSPDPENGELVQLVVSPQVIESAEPKDAVVSFVLPDAHDFDTSATNVMSKFCHFVFFFTSRSSGERWMAKHPGTFLYSPDEAFALAKRLNARNFGQELARRILSAAATQQA